MTMNRASIGLAAFSLFLATLLVIPSETQPVFAASVSKYCHALDTAKTPSIPLAPKGSLTVSYASKVIGGLQIYKNDLALFVKDAPSPRARDVFQGTLISIGQFGRSMSIVYSDLVYLGNHPNDSSAIANYKSDLAATDKPYHNFLEDIRVASALSAKLCPES